MAHPRRIVPFETYLITRRCYQRTLRLRPSAETNRIFGYCLALAMQKTGVLLHAACVMSNHHHLVITDPRGLLPDFLRELHRLTAKAMNASQGQWENLWAAEPCNAVRLVTAEDIVDKIAYVVANPVAAGLVARPEDWPGLLVWGERTLHVSRPRHYFRADGECAPELSFQVKAPEPQDGGARGREWYRRVAEAIDAKVAKAHNEFRSARRAFQGRSAIPSRAFTERARSFEEKRGLKPTFAAGAKAVRDELRRVERHFRLMYRKALDVWRIGARQAVFPFGTWAMRVFHGVAIASPVVTAIGSHVCR